MHKSYISGADLTTPLDFNHYKLLWQQGLKDTTSTNLCDRLAYTGVICSPHGFDISTLNEHYTAQYITAAEKNSIVFVHDYNTFYTDSFLTFAQLTTIARWRHALDNLNNTPLHDVKHHAYKEEDFLLVWMFKHNMKYTIIDKSF